MEEEVLKYYEGFGYLDFEKMVDDIFEQLEKSQENTDVTFEYRNINGNIKYFINEKEVSKFEYETQMNKVFPNKNQIIYIPQESKPYIVSPYTHHPYITTPKIDSPFIPHLQLMRSTNGLLTNWC